MKTLKSLAMASAVVMAVSAAQQASAQSDEEFRFVMVSHIGSNDPNMNWLALSLEEFEKKHPNVTT